MLPCASFSQGANHVTVAKKIFDLHGYDPGINILQVALQGGCSLHSVDKLKHNLLRLAPVATGKVASI